MHYINWNCINMFAHAFKKDTYKKLIFSDSRACGLSCFLSSDHGHNPFNFILLEYPNELPVLWQTTALRANSTCSALHFSNYKNKNLFLSNLMQIFIWRDTIQDHNNTYIMVLIYQLWYAFKILIHLIFKTLLQYSYFTISI